MSHFTSPPGSAESAPAPVHIYNLLVLDASGSMESIKGATLRGFNELVQSIQGSQRELPDQRHFVSLCVFNSLRTALPLFNQPVGQLHALTDATYRPDAGTPLYDAMGSAVLKMKTALLAHAAPFHVLVTVLTDGEENASREFRGPQIKALIEEQQAQGWTFSFVGANHDVVAAAAALSIKPENTMAYDANAGSAAYAFEKLGSAQRRFSRNLRANPAPSPEAIQDRDFFSEEDRDSKDKPA